MLTDAEITSMRASVAQALPDDVTIQAVTRTVDAAGGWSEVWSTSGSAKGRLASEARFSREGDVSARLSAISSFRVTLPALTAVTPANRLVVSGKTLEIVEVLDAGAWELATICHCAEVA